MTHTKQKQFMVLWLSTELATIHPKMSPFISSDWSWWDSVSQSHLSIYASPTSSRGRLWRSAAPCWTAPGTHPTGAGIREQIWIFYFWFIKVIIYFFIVPLPMCVGKCFVFYTPPSPPPPPKYITCKEIQRHSVWEVKRITQYYLS